VNYKRQNVELRSNPSCMPQQDFGCQMNAKTNDSPMTSNSKQTYRTQKFRTL